MSKATCQRDESKRKISKVEPTDQRITGRGGMTLFVHYIDQIQVIPMLLMPLLGCLRKNRKGVPVDSLLKQIFCFFLDGTSRHLSYFDTLQKDSGYAAAIETAPRHMASSHAVKRFFQVEMEGRPSFAGVREGIGRPFWTHEPPARERGTSRAMHTSR